MTTLPDLTNPDYNAIVVSRGWTDEAEIRAMRLYASTYGTRIVYLHADESMVGNAATPGGAFDGFVAFDTAPYAKAVGDVMTTNQVRCRCVLRNLCGCVCGPCSICMYATASGKVYTIARVPCICAVFDCMCSTHAHIRALIYDGSESNKFDLHNRVGPWTALWSRSPCSPRTPAPGP